MNVNLGGEISENSPKLEDNGGKRLQCKKRLKSRGQWKEEISAQKRLKSMDYGRQKFVSRTLQ